MKRLFLAALAAAFLSCGSAFAAFPAANEVSVDIPFEGGAMLMVARDYRVSRYIRLGVIAGGGQIRRRPEVKLPDGTETELDIQTSIFPFIGPRITFATPVVGLSLGFAAFRAVSDVEIDWPGTGRFAGSTSGWGTGFHAPFLELEFAHPVKDIAVGIGIGGFFSTSFPDLTAEGPGGTLSFNDSPINTLTGRLKFVWGFGRVRAAREEDDDL
jgi:hypothetical protein